MRRPELWGWSTSPLTIAFWGWENSRELLKPHLGCIPTIIHSRQVSCVLKCWPSASSAVHVEAAAKSIYDVRQAISVANPATAPRISWRMSACSIVRHCNTTKAQMSHAIGKVVEESQGPQKSVGLYHLSAQASGQQPVPRVSI